MWTTKDGFVLRRRWGTVLLLIASACSAASLPSTGEHGGTTVGGGGGGGGGGGTGAGGPLPEHGHQHAGRRDHGHEQRRPPDDAGHWLARERLADGGTARRRPRHHAPAERERVGEHDSRPLRDQHHVHRFVPERQLGRQLRYSRLVADLLGSPLLLAEHRGCGRHHRAARTAGRRPHPLQDHALRADRGDGLHLLLDHPHRLHEERLAPRGDHGRGADRSHARDHGPDRANDGRQRHRRDRRLVGCAPVGARLSVLPLPRRSSEARTTA